MSLLTTGMIASLLDPKSPSLPRAKSYLLIPHDDTGHTPRSASPQDGEHVLNTQYRLGPRGEARRTRSSQASPERRTAGLGSYPPSTSPIRTKSNHRTDCQFLCKRRTRSADYQVGHRCITWLWRDSMACRGGLSTILQLL